MQKTDNRLMEARELRVGNWVETPDGIKQLDIVADFEIRAEEIYYLLEEVRPIPITPEILEAAGFVKEYENPAHISYGADNPKIGVYYFKDGSTPMFRYISEKNIPCPYLHSLQNLVHALTGSELPMTFKSKI